MGRMADLEIDVVNMLDEGYSPISIAAVLNIPIKWIYDVAETQQPESNTEVFSPYDTINS